MKTCIYCGLTKEDEEFRQYYNRKSGRYTYCKDCEKIEARRKYLCRKDNRSEAEELELQKINKLYDARRAAGLQAPGQSRIKPSVVSRVDDELRRLSSNGN